MAHTGPQRQDDRRIISGIVHRSREGCRWRALPGEHGPHTTVFNRYNRWRQRGLCLRQYFPGRLGGGKDHSDNTVIFTRGGVAPAKVRGRRLLASDPRGDEETGQLLMASRLLVFSQITSGVPYE